MNRCKNCGQPAPRSSIFAAEKTTSVCGLCEGWSFDAPVEAEAAELYDESYFNGKEYANYLASQPVHRRNFERKLGILKSKSLLPRDGWRVLEIGCATGEFGSLIMATRDAGSRPRYIGIEVSEYCRTLAQSNGLRVFSPRDPEAEAAIQELRPNIIVGWDVWEHLPDPIDTLGSLLRFSDAGTVVALTTVDTGSWIPRLTKDHWRQYHPPTHLNYPTRKSFEIYCKNSNLDIVYHHSFGYTRPWAEYIRPFSKLLFKRSPRWRWMYKMPLYLNLLDTQMLVARKRA